MEESIERYQYRVKCQYCLMPNYLCLKRSGAVKNGFIDCVCVPDANCRRMKRYDKKIKETPETNKPA